MRISTGTVISGKVVLNDSGIADGTDVYVVTRENDGAVVLSPEECTELDIGIAEADRGELIPGTVFFEQLRRHG